jgi:hypothetical protein
MTDEQFDALAKKALAADLGPPRESQWNRVRPVRWSWMPSVREILVSGCVCGLALLFVGLRTPRRHQLDAASNMTIQSALHDEKRSVLASVTWIADAPAWPSPRSSRMRSYRPDHDWAYGQPSD